MNRDTVAPSQFPRSLELLEAARRVIPGGVTSSIRANARPHPIYFERGEGPFLWDVDGRRYVDFALGYGPLILGHSPEVLRDAVAAQLERASTLGAQHRLEPAVAELVVDSVPGAEQAIFASTGSEAVAAALRVARATTGRNLVVKFEGHYHGWLDGVFAGIAYDPERSGPADNPNVVPATLGVSPTALGDLLVAPWNDLASVERLLAARRDEVAAVILEVLLVNGGVIEPIGGFLEGLRELTERYGAFLVFDEVITGFRLALGGAQEHYGVTADLAVFGKAIAGGLPLSAVTGSRKHLHLIADGRLHHNGTFNGNPLAMAAAAATVGHLSAERDVVYERIAGLATRLAKGLRAVSAVLTVRQCGPILQTAFGEPGRVISVRDRSVGDGAVHAVFIEALLRHGIHVTSRGLWYVSTAHTEVEIDEAIEAARAAIAALRP